MCEQCMINPLYFGEVFPGYTLIKGRRESNETKLGQWGLVMVNDPSFTFTFDFHEQIGTRKWNDQEETLWKQLSCNPHNGWHLVAACIGAGYNPEQCFVPWFATTIREWLVTHGPLIVEPGDEDPFPQLDKTCAHDYSEWVRPTALTKGND